MTELPRAAVDTDRVRRKGPTARKAERKKSESRKRARKKLLDQGYENERVEELIKKIKNGKEHWLTFVTEPGLEPANNQAERALREHVVHRKIIGGLRTQKGTKIHETIMTLLTTWKQQDLDPYQELIKAVKC